MGWSGGEEQGVWEEEEGDKDKAVGWEEWDQFSSWKFVKIQKGISSPALASSVPSTRALPREPKI
jgi:hypothetical protein